MSLFSDPLAVFALILGIPFTIVVIWVAVVSIRAWLWYRFSLSKRERKGIDDRIEKEIGEEWARRGYPL